MEFQILFHRGWMFQDALYILVQTLISNIKNITIKPLLSEFLKAFGFLSVLEEIASTVTKVWLQDKPALGIGCRCVTSKCVGVHQHRTPTVFLWNQSINCHLYFMAHPPFIHLLFGILSAFFLPWYDPPWCLQNVNINPSCKCKYSTTLWHSNLYEFLQWNKNKTFWRK